ncbi:iron-sulfur cluster co-chaperone protein HscB homolog [Phragmites australis]|uniref:iron-sulfur cluster co-chaperone protein HscB homolog n=1 Tax=Phragmites australis TaxID=29695 RepID=UPI002D79D574|nr:iron-sulfur cluster co-chaperone protein HscB homolog [Phragmites australis]
MWRRAGAGRIRLHLNAAAAAAAAGRRVRRPLLPPIPTAPSSSASCSSPSGHNLGIIRDSIRAPSRSLSNQASRGGDGGSVCWSCGARGAFLSCGSCGSVQPIDPAVDYFQIFGLKREYNIKDNSLEGKYKDWQKKLHPDLVHTKSEKERGFAAEQSALVIDAYRTLSRPLSRALYLLLLEGIHVDEEKTISDPELLMEMMEIREAVNDASDSQTLEKIQSQIKRKLETWSDSFQEAFDKRDFDRAVEATQRMKYYERAMEETVKKL